MPGGGRGESYGPIAAVPATRRANGVKMGRKPKLTPHQKREAIRRRDRGEDSLAEIGRSYQRVGMDDFEVDDLTLAIMGCY